MSGASKPAPSTSAAYSVNASSMLSLLSEVSKHQESGSGNRRKRRLDSGDADSSTSKTAAIFDRKNRGLEARSARDRSHMLSREDLSAEARRVLESREKLEKKAKLYEKLARGETVKGISADQLRQGLLVDFEEKAVKESYKNRQRETDSGSDDEESESEIAGKKNDKQDDDELVEITDDLGRTRWIRKSQVAQSQLNAQSNGVPLKGAHEGGVAVYSNDIKLASSSWHPADNRNTYYGDQTQFHVYEPTPEEMAARRKALNLDAPLAEHFDSTKEIRTRGAGFIQLSKDEETRKQQLAQLEQDRLETEDMRAKATAQGDANAKREKDIQDRKRLIEEKRRAMLDKRKAQMIPP